MPIYKNATTPAAAKNDTTPKPNFSAPLEGATDADGAADDERADELVDRTLELEAELRAAEDDAMLEDAAVLVAATAAPPTVLGSAVLVAVAELPSYSDRKSAICASATMPSV